MTADTPADLPGILQALADTRDAMNRLEGLVRAQFMDDPDTWSSTLKKTESILLDLADLEEDIDGYDQIPF